MAELPAEWSARHSADRALLSRPYLVSMCEACECVPVPVLFLNQGINRGLYVCASCLAEEGIHLEDEDFSTLTDTAAPLAA